MKIIYTYIWRKRARSNSLGFFTMLVFLAFIISSCDEFVKIAPPTSEIVSKTVYTDDGTAISAIRGIYSEMWIGNLASGGGSSVSLIGGLISDELINQSSFQSWIDISNNNLSSQSTGNATGLWNEAYKFIYYANSILEGVDNSAEITETAANQLMGEAKFLRAFFHFYLVNLFGDVPYINTTDYLLNNVVEREAVTVVYEKIIQDLKDAQSLLAEDYSFSAGERVQPNKFVATALLARAYLYTEDWANAEAEASKIIQNNATYELEELNHAFLKNNKEAIWQLPSVTGNSRTNESAIFIRRETDVINYGTLTHELLLAFEDNDMRRKNWVDSTIRNEIVHYFPFKYKVEKTNVPITEYSTLMRLAELYLIRAEARAHQGDITGAQTDINAIRERAGLGNTTASDQTALLLAIEHERRVELFTEWGHRWFDLIRTGRAGAVLSGFGSKDWQDTDVLFPIPQTEIENNPNMVQNPGYN